MRSGTAGMRSTIVDPELRHWARHHFRPATMHGNLHDIRARELARREGESIGMYVMIGALALTGGFVVGRWWKRRQPSATTKPNLHLVGTDVLGAR